VSTIKVDDELKEELTLIQSKYQSDKTPSYNEIVRNAVKVQELSPILLQYIHSRIENWNPYDVLSWFYDENKRPMEKELVEVYAELIMDIGNT
jgi:hypothetical protein